MSGVNWNDLLETAGHVGALPPGPYDVEVTKAVRKDATTGKLMYNVTFKVLSGPHANATIFNNFVVSKDNPTAMGFFFRHMAAMGLTRDFFATNPAPEQVAQALHGKFATLDVINEEYQGVDQTRVKSVRPFQGTSPTSQSAASTPPPPPPPAAKTKKAAAPAPEVDETEDDDVDPGTERELTSAGKSTPPPAPF